MFCFGIFVLSLFGTALSCYRDKGFNPTMEDLFNASDIVVYGEDLEHFDVNTTFEMLPIATNSLFKVFCILKSDGKEILENITIEAIFPRSSCSLTRHSVGDRVIVSLRRMNSGNYEWHEVNVLQKASYEASEETFNRTSSVLSSQKWVPPSDSQNNLCPSEYLANTVPEKVQVGNADNNKTSDNGSTVHTVSELPVFTKTENTSIVTLKGKDDDNFGEQEYTTDSKVTVFPVDTKSEKARVGHVSSDGDDNTNDNAAAFQQSCAISIFVACFVLLMNTFTL